MVNTPVEKLSPTRVKLTISVTPEELKPSITHAYEHIAEQVHIPGFRKGKVPPPIIDQRVGSGAVLEHAVNEGLDGSSAPPSPSTSSARSAARGRHRRVAEREGLLGRPAARRRGRRAPRDRAARLRRHRPHRRRGRGRRRRDRRGARPPAQPLRHARHGRPSRRDRRLRRRSTSSPTIDGAEVDSADGISYELGSGELLEGIDEALDSLTAGETTTFRSKLLGGDHEGETAEITVTVTAVKERELPEADDDFAQIASEFDTLAELRDSLATRVAQQSTFAQGVRPPRPARRQAPRARRDPGAAAAHRGRGAPPPRGRGPPRRRRAPRRGHRGEREAVPDADPARRHRRGEKVQVSQDELTQYLVQGAAQYGMEPQRVRPDPAAEQPDPRHGRRGRPQQGARDRARQGEGRRRQRRARRPLRVRRRRGRGGRRGGRRRRGGGDRG